MMAYAAYLQIYESLSVLGEPNRTRWNSYALRAAQPRTRTLSQDDEAPRPRFAEFNPYSTIEMDHGGPVRLRNDETFMTDESVAGMAAVCQGPVRSEWEVAVAMDHRALARWRRLRVAAFAN